MSPELCCVGGEVCEAGSEALQVVAAAGGDGGGLGGGGWWGGEAETLTVVLHSHQYGFRPGDTSATCRHELDEGELHPLHCQGLTHSQRATDLLL